MRCLTQSNLRISAIDSIKIRLLQFIDAIVIENEHSLDIHSLLDFEEIFKIESYIAALTCRVNVIWCIS